MCKIFDFNEIYFIMESIPSLHCYEIEWFIILTICYFKIFTFRAAVYVIFVYFFRNLIYLFFTDILSDVKLYKTLFFTNDLSFMPDFIQRIFNNFVSEWRQNG